MALTSKPLTTKTWPAFARLVEKHNGIFGGCWCISFHLEPGERRHGAAAYRAMKEQRVREGQAHAAVIFDGPDAVGWCQFGPTEELPNIRSKKTYEQGLRKLPDWRITCFFIDRERRGKGIATLALREAPRFFFSWYWLCLLHKSSLKLRRHPTETALQAFFIRRFKPRQPPSIRRDSGRWQMRCWDRIPIITM